MVGKDRGGRSVKVELSSCKSYRLEDGIENGSLSLRDVKASRNLQPNISSSAGASPVQQAPSLEHLANNTAANDARGKKMGSVGAGRSSHRHVNARSLDWALSIRRPHVSVSGVVSSLWAQKRFVNFVWEPEAVKASFRDGAKIYREASRVSTGGTCALGGNYAVTGTEVK